MLGHRAAHASKHCQLIGSQPPIVTMALLLQAALRRRLTGLSCVQTARLLSAGQLEGLASCLDRPESLSTAQVIQEQHSHDESYHPSALPDAGMPSHSIKPANL